MKEPVTSRERSRERLKGRFGLWERGRLDGSRRGSISGNCFLEAGSGRWIFWGLPLPSPNGWSACGSWPGGCTHRDWEDQLWVPCEICNVSVERHPLLSCSSLTHGQGHAQDGVRTKLGWNRTELNEGMSYPPAFLQLAFPPGPPLCEPWIVF